MRALVSTGYGSPEQVLAVAEVQPPAAGPGQVLVKVEAAALNPFDLYLITGAMRDQVPMRHPYTVGTDVAGLVADVGEGVPSLARGEQVLGLATLAAGSVAEYTVVPAGPTLVRRPADLDPVHAAAVPQAGLTAQHLMRVIGPKRGDRVLVIGATGGVGMFAVQMLVAAGAEVIATATERDACYVTGLGAVDVIDYTTKHVAREARLSYPEGVDVVLDLVHTGADLAGSAEAAHPDGRVVSALDGPDLFERGIHGVYIGQMKAEPGGLDLLADRASTGILRVEVGATYPLDDAVRAVREFAGRHIRGKVIITV